MNEYNEEAIVLVLRKVDLGTFRFYLSNIGYLFTLTFSQLPCDMDF